jgi:hypothetical protein
MDLPGVFARLGTVQLAMLFDRHRLTDRRRHARFAVLVFLIGPRAPAPLPAAVA